MGLDKKTIRDVDCTGKRVLVRCDFNVPLDGGTITDDRRIREALPTLQYLLDAGAKIIVCSHLGRPKGPDPSLSLAPVAERLSHLLGRPVRLMGDCVGPEIDAAARDMQPGEVILLENLRFHPEEEKNDPEFARRLAALAELYVNDAFGTAHRAHASTEGVAHHIPGVAGFLMQKEIEYLGNALESPKRPFVAVLGGAKVKDKIGVIDNLLPKVDALLIGGGMAFTFLKARGYEIGRSLLDESHLAYAEGLGDGGGKVHLPVDVVCAPELSPSAPTVVVPASGIPADQIGADIGPDTRARFGEIVRGAGTVVWNGPLGVFEMEPFAEGTRELCRALAECPGVTIVGGGDSAAAIEKFGYADRVAHVSTGGGASLEFMEGKALPGVVVLQDR